MTFNPLTLFLTKFLAERENVSSQRALELGLVTSFIPGNAGLLLGVVAARREAPQSRTGTTDVTGTPAKAGVPQPR
jgi:hypothetical protein